MFVVLYRGNGEACGVRAEDGTMLVWGSAVPVDEAKRFAVGLDDGLSAEELQELVVEFLLKVLQKTKGAADGAEEKL